MLLDAGTHHNLTPEDEALLIALRLATKIPPVIPAQAGIHLLFKKERWIPDEDLQPNAMRLGKPSSGMTIPFCFPFCGETMTDDNTTHLKLITAPASEPLSVAEAKLFLRIEHTADDALVTRAIAASREAAEQYLRSALLPQIWEYTVANPYRCEVRLPFGPAQSITSIVATDSAGEENTLDSDTYKLSVDGSMVLFVNTPSSEKIAIRYSASVASDAATLPALIKQGMLHHIAAMLEQREGIVPLPMQSIACYMPYRKMSL